MFIGAEFIVIYYLHKKGVKPSKSTWIAIMDIVTEVLAAGILSIMAGIIALLNGAYVVAGVVLATSITVTPLWMVLFFLSSKHTFQVPKILLITCTKIWKRKRSKIVESDKFLDGRSMHNEPRKPQKLQNQKKFLQFLSSFFCILVILWNFIYDNCNGYWFHH